LSAAEYVNWRESLVPIAAAEADARSPNDAVRWDAVFHRAMERLINCPFMRARFGR
jgi:hypothetical protein